MVLSTIFLSVFSYKKETKRERALVPATTVFKITKTGIERLGWIDSNSQNKALFMKPALLQFSNGNFLFPDSFLL